MSKCVRQTFVRVTDFPCSTSCPKSGDPTHHEGSICSDETWYAVNNPYILIDGLAVETTLILELGAPVNFNVGIDIEVGYLNSTGPATLLSS